MAWRQIRYFRAVNVSFVSCVASVDGKVNYSGVQKDQGVTFNNQSPPTLFRRVWTGGLDDLRTLWTCRSGILKCGHTIRLFNAIAAFCIYSASEHVFSFISLTLQMSYMCTQNRHNMDCFIRFYWNIWFLCTYARYTRCNF